MSIAVSSGGQVGVVPVLRYRDVEEALSWLSRAFGFQESRFVRDAEGKARYAQLACGDSMVMLCPLGGSAFDACMMQPAEIGGYETQIVYVHVGDVEAHKARAIEAGAEIVLDMVGGEEGRGQGYTCRDFEGHIWSFGTYDPWRHTRVTREPDTVPVHRGLLAGALTGLAVVAALAIGYVRFNDGYSLTGSSALANIDSVLEKPTDLANAEKLLRQAREELMRERSQRMLAERQAQEHKDATTREREARAASDKALAEKSEKLAKTEKAAAEQVALRQEATPPSPVRLCEAEADAKSVRTASLSGNSADDIKALKAAMERAQAELSQERQGNAKRATALGELREELERERTARERAERQVRDALARLARLDPARKPEPVQKGQQFYKDLSREVFPLSSVPR